MLAKDVNDNAGSLIRRGTFRFFASMLAPTEGLAKTNVSRTRRGTFIAANPGVSRAHRLPHSISESTYINQRMI